MTLEKQLGRENHFTIIGHRGGLSNRKRSWQFYYCFHSRLTFSSLGQTAHEHLKTLHNLLPLVEPRLTYHEAVSCRPQEQKFHISWKDGYMYYNDKRERKNVFITPLRQ